MEEPVDKDHPLWRVVDEETRLLARVQSHLATAEAHVQGTADYDKDMVDLRDQVGEARLEDVPALIQQMLQVAAVRSQRGLGQSLPVDSRNPYFAHLRLVESGKSRDVLIGKRSYVDGASGIAVVDWRHAPVSRVYYRYEEGESYEEEFGERLREGVVEVRRTVSVADGRLVRIRTPEVTLLCHTDGRWFSTVRGQGPELHGGAGVAVRPQRQAKGPGFAKRQKERTQLGLGGDTVLREDKRLPEIAALIDKPQFDLITRPEAGVVVLQGGAGSGKTTVALHRVAWLHFQAPDKFRPRNMRVLVSQPALVAYIGRVLPGLDVGATPVLTMDNFVGQLIRQLFPGKRRRLVQDVPDTVARLKKHPAMLNLLEQLVEQRVDDAGSDLREMTAKLPGGAAASATWDRGGRTLHARLTALWRWLHSGAASTHVVDRVTPYMKSQMEDLQQPHIMLQEALSDGPFLRQVLDEHAAGQFTDEQLRAVVAFVTRQSQEPDDDSLVDLDARTPIDGSGDDPTDPTGRLDEHDGPLLVRLHQLLHGGLVPQGRSAVEFDHVAVDEAQDLSAIQLQILADCTRNQSITLAGDTAQRLVFDNAFDTWTGLLEHLKIPSLNVSTLKVAYRSTREVTEVARHILGPLADPDPPQAPRSGAPVDGFRFRELGEEVSFLAEQLRGLMARERGANLALLTRYTGQAKVYFDALEKAEVPNLRWVAHQDFSFTPGIDVTDVTQVKGLEYDYVIMCGVDDVSYPETLESRHLLHIGATRAAHQLWFTVHRPASIMIPPDIWQDA